MNTAWRPELLRWIGLGAAWLAAPLAAPAPGDWRLPVWLVNLALFSVLFGFANDAICARWSPGKRLLLLVALALSGLALVIYGGVFAATYPVLVAALAGSSLASRAAWTLVGGQTLCLFLAFALSRFSTLDAALLALVFGGLMLFVVHTAQVALAEREARARLAETHRELEAAQGVLAERSRDAERVRIAGDLHDVLGHHLTALSLTLEAASHADADAKAVAIDDALVQTKRLLRDLRQVVSKLAADPVDFAVALRRLAAETRTPRVELALADPLPAPGADATTALVRAAQEAITNAARHGRAARIRIDVEAAEGGIQLRARDDGAAGAPEARDIRPGHGLSGIAERARGCGGRATWTVQPQGGFELAVWVPATPLDR